MPSSAPVSELPPMPEAAAPAVVSAPAAQSEPLADPEDVRLRKRWFARVRSELQSEKGKAVEEEDYLRAHDLKLLLMACCRYMWPKLLRARMGYLSIHTG